MLSWYEVEIVFDSSLWQMFHLSNLTVCLLITRRLSQRRRLNRVHKSGRLQTWEHLHRHLYTEHRSRRLYDQSPTMSSASETDRKHVWLRWKRRIQKTGHHVSDNGARSQETNLQRTNGRRWRYTQLNVVRSPSVTQQRLCGHSLNVWFQRIWLSILSLIITHLLKLRCTNEG